MDDYSYGFSSLFGSQRKFGFMRTTPKSIFTLLLIISGDIETCSGPFNKGISQTRTEFKQTLSKKGMKFVHQNIRGLSKNFDLLQEFITEHSQVDIVSLSETHLGRYSLEENVCKLDGYLFIGRSRSKGSGGGVGIYEKENIIFERRKDLEHDTLETLWIEIFIKNAKSILFGCYYRPPETSKYLPNDFNALLSENINNVNSDKKDTIIMGDFNINYNDSKSHKEFKNVMKLNGFKRLITSATRITKESSTLIDLIFSNRPSSLPSVSVVSTSLSDHDLVACTRKNTQKYLPRTIKCRNYAKYDTKLLADDVRNIDWQPIYDNNSDVNTAVIYLSKQLLQIFNTHAPVVEKRVKGKSCEWLDETIKKEMNTRDQVLRRARRRNDETSWREYKQQRNKCTNKVKKQKHLSIIVC